jgi:hypothetical protein
MESTRDTRFPRLGDGETGWTPKYFPFCFEPNAQSTRRW